MKEIQWRYSTPEAVWQTGTPISAKGKANLRLNGVEYQKMFGFGGCFNEQGYEALKTLPENKQDSLLKELFAADADSPEVNIWVSKVNATDSGMEKGLEKQTPVHFGSGDSASTNNLIVVDENNTYQTVDGFGASITEASAHLYQTNLDDSAKAAAMQALFDKESGIGLSMLRQTIGASDHCVAPYNFAPDEQDDSLPNWDFSHELIEIMPTVQDALAVETGRITVMASCWSPPGWMKENGSVLGMYQNQKGTLRADKYQAYANYITKFIQEYASRGIDIYAVTPNNEPDHASYDWPASMLPMVNALSHSILMETPETGVALITLNFI